MSLIKFLPGYKKAQAQREKEIQAINEREMVRKFKAMACELAAYLIINDPKRVIIVDSYLELMQEMYELCTQYPLLRSEFEHHHPLIIGEPFPLLYNVDIRRSPEQLKKSQDNLDWESIEKDSFYWEGSERSLDSLKYSLIHSDFLEFLAHSRIACRMAIDILNYLSKDAQG